MTYSFVYVFLHSGAPPLTHTYTYILLLFGVDFPASQQILTKKCSYMQTVQDLFTFWSKYCIVISDGVILSLFSLLVLILQL